MTDPPSSDLPGSREETTLRKIAEIAGVARSTVSRALRNHPRIGEATRQRIHAIAEEVGYRRDAYLSELMVRLRHRKEHAERPVIAMIFWQNYRVRSEILKGRESITGGAWHRALECGFQPELFNLTDFGPDRRRVLEILRYRGILGCILHPPQVPAPLPDLPWEYLSVVAIGPALFSHHLHRSTPNHQQQMLECIAQLRLLGYRRIAFTMTPAIVQRSGGVYQGTYLLARQQSPRIFPAAPLTISKTDETRFLRWYDRVQPDALICASTLPFVTRWLESRGIRAPDQVGLANLQLYRRDQESGIWQNAYEIGQGAMDLLNTLLERNERGLPSIARTLSFNGEWIAGNTTRPMA